MIKCAVITADLINSTSLKKNQLTLLLTTLQELLKDMQSGKKDEKRLFALWRGDSIQGIMEEPESSLKLALEIKAGINRLSDPDKKKKLPSRLAWPDLKISIVLGEITKWPASLASANEDLFRQSGLALDALKSSSRKMSVITGKSEADKELNVHMILLQEILNQWSTGAAEVVYHLLKGKSEKEIAAELGISQSAVNQRKRASGWESIQALLNRFREITLNS